jgi:hypothetical protein
MVSDKAITYTGGTPLQSDANIKKVRKIGKTQWYALIAGDPTFSLRVIEIVERILAEQAKKQPKEQSGVLHHTVLMSVFKMAYKQARGAYVEDTVLAPRMLTKELFTARPKELLPLDADFFSELSNTCNDANPGASLMVCGFDPDSKPHIFSVLNPGRLSNHDMTGFHAIGGGSRTALARLLQLDANKNDGIGMALYQAFEAKVHAELVQGVGYSWDAEILIVGKSKNVPERIVRLIENIYAAYPKTPLNKKQWKSPRNYKSRLNRYISELLNDPKPRRRSTARKSEDQQ